jgi:hypothetical protein
MHILVHIYVSYAMLNNMFTHFSRISRSTTGLPTSTKYKRSKINYLIYVET